MFESFNTFTVLSSSFTEFQKVGPRKEKLLLPVVERISGTSTFLSPVRVLYFQWLENNYEDYTQDLIPVCNTLQLGDIHVFVLKSETSDIYACH